VYKKVLVPHFLISTPNRRAAADFIENETDKREQLSTADGGARAVVRHKH